MLLCSRERNLSSCESAVYNDSPTAGGAPLMNPPQITDAMTQCLNVTEKAQKALSSVCTELEAKKKVSLRAL